jgi:hypothetical protein
VITVTLTLAIQEKRKIKLNFVYRLALKRHPPREEEESLGGRLKEEEEMRLW